MNSLTPLLRLSLVGMMCAALFACGDDRVAPQTKPLPEAVTPPAATPEPAVVQTEPAPAAPVTAEAAPEATFPAPLRLAQQRNCLTCHTLTQKTVGPAWRSVAEKYQGQDVKAMLIDKVQNGGSGNFGSVAMPPNASKISVAETAYLVDWILKGAPN